MLLLAVLLAVLLLLLLCLVLVVLSRTLGETAILLKGEDGEVDDDVLMLGEEGMHFLLLGDSIEDRNLLGDIMLGEASSEGGGGGGGGEGVIMFLDKKLEKLFVNADGVRLGIPCGMNMLL
jgi:hypothetical protein